MASPLRSLKAWESLCASIEAVASYTAKTELCAKHFDRLRAEAPECVFVCIKLLLAKEDARVYRLRDKQWIKLLAVLLHIRDDSDMLGHLELGDISETARHFWEASGEAAASSSLSMLELDAWLDQLATMTKDEERIPHFRNVLPRLTPVDLKWLVRIVDHDLKINLGAKFVLEALHPNAFEAFKNTNNLRNVVDKVMRQLSTVEASTASAKPGLQKQLSTNISLFHPIKPMLAKPCKSFDEIWTRCKNGMFAEIKYDGERVQIHKRGDEFQYFSRNLKQVTEHKVADLKQYIPQSIVADDIILDAEILLCEAGTNKPLPFGSLGVHKKKGYADATICIFIFDIFYVDGEDLMKVPYAERRNRLVALVKEIPGHVRLAEAFEIKTEDDLSVLWNRVIREGLEGLMIKASDGEYHPAARHWLKLKKDYLGGMADTADLIVLGANLGTGQKGGLRSSFLMGVYDSTTKRFKTVCKCANGFDDATLLQLQQIPMVKCTADTVPDWLDVDRALVPAFVVPDPKNSPVWAIEGAQFSKSERHTAGGYSIRFPRLQRFRDDKDWTTATNLAELIDLAETSLKNTGGSGADDDDEDEDAPKAKKSAAAAPKKLPVSPAKPPKKSAAPASSSSIAAFMKSSAPSIGQAENGIHYVVGDITAPHGNSLKTQVILHFIDDSATWPNRGVFAAISQKFKKAETAYLKNASQLPLGESMLVRVQQRTEQLCAVYVGLLVCMEKPSGPGKLPSFKSEHLDPILQQTSDWAQSSDVGSIHIARPRIDTPGLLWPIVEMALVSHFIKHKIEVCILRSLAESILVVGATNSLTRLFADVYSMEPHPEIAQMSKEPTSTKKRAQPEPQQPEMLPRAPKRVKVSLPGFTEVFENVVAAFHGHVERQQLLRSLLMVDGAVVLPDGGDVSAATHIICSAEWDDVLSLYLSENSALKIVKPAWIVESLQKGTQLPERSFFVEKT